MEVETVSKNFNDETDVLDEDNKEMCSIDLNNSQEFTPRNSGLQSEDRSVIDYVSKEQEDKEDSLEHYQLELPYSCFTRVQKVVIFSIIMLIGFLGPMSGNIYIPALPLIQEKFQISTTVVNATVSVFMGIFAIGPLFWGMFADFGGRKILYLLSLLLMTITNVLLTSLPVSVVSLFILRVVQALSSSSVITLGAGTVTDIISPKNRGKAIAYFMMGPNIGPVLAPIIAGIILIKKDNWRWLFGFTCIVSGLAFFLVLVFLPETLRCIVGNGDPRWKDMVDLEQNNLEVPQNADVKLFNNIGIQKPVSTNKLFTILYPKPKKLGLSAYWQMVKLEPVLFTSISTSLLFANYYAFSVTFSHFLQTEYSYSMLEIGAAYVCPGLSMIFGSQFGGHLSDYLRRRWEKKHVGKSFPLEERLVLNILGILINTAGCIGYGWSIEKKFHVAIILLFTGLLGAGLTWCNNATMTYLTEILAQRAASSVAVSSFFRNIAAAISSAIIFILCNSMGIGWCFTGLGLMNIISILLIAYLIKCSGSWQNKVSNI